MADGKHLREAGDRIERLLEEVRSMVSPPAWDKTDELIRLVIDFYAAGLERIVAAIAEGHPTRDEIKTRLVKDDLVASLLVLHGLHPESVTARVERALEEVRPYLGSHGGDIDLEGVDEQAGVVRLRMRGSCDGCPSSILTVKVAVEGAIQKAAPEIVRVDVEGVTEAAPPPATDDSPWQPLAAAGDVGRGELRAIEVTGTKLVLCRLGEQLYAYRDFCPSCDSPFEGAGLEGNVLECPSCREHYDVRLAGRSMTKEDLHLEPLPLLEDGEGARIAIPEARA